MRVERDEYYLSVRRRLVWGNILGVDERRDKRNKGRDDGKLYRLGDWLLEEIGF
jgi:hypothetical protein